MSSGGSSAFADIGAGRVLRQQCGGLLAVAASSSRTAASCSSELILPTQPGRSAPRGLNGWFVCAPDVARNPAISTYRGYRLHNDSRTPRKPPGSLECASLLKLEPQSTRKE